MPSKKPLRTDGASIAARNAARIEFAAAPSDALFRADVVAIATGTTPKTLESWRSTGKGPTFIRVGRSIHYRKRDIEAWFAREGWSA